MRSYYAYSSTDGKEPMGTANRILFKLKTDAGAVRRAIRLLGPANYIHVFQYTNFYDNKTWRIVG